MVFLTIVTKWDDVFWGIWSYYDAHNNTIELKDNLIYTNDTFGLRTLDENGNLTLTVVQNAKHSDWIHNKNTWSKYVLPFLN